MNSSPPNRTTKERQTMRIVRPYVTFFVIAAVIVTAVVLHLVFHNTIPERP